MKFLPLIFLLILTGCPGAIPGSKSFSPEGDLKISFDESLKNVMPSDVLKNPDQYTGKQIHWIGILESYKFIKNDLLRLTLNQKYWDYIEDYSVQTERIFLSPLGEGIFYLDIPFAQSKKNEIDEYFDSASKRKDLVFAYGTFSGIVEGVPILQYRNASYVHERYYSTAIFKYEISRDENGKVITDDRGLPKVKNLVTLKTPMPGKND